MTQSVFIVTHMDCPAEERLVRNRLESVEGIDGLEFDLMQRRLTVTHRLDDEAALVAALRSIGMDATSYAPTPTSPESGEGRSEGAVPRVSAWTRLRMAVSGVAAVAAEALAASGGREDSTPVIALALASIAVGGPETLRKGWIALRNRTLNIHFLMTVAVIGAVAIGQWPEAAMVTFLFGVAEMIEALSLDRARNAVRRLMEMTPATVTVRADDGEWREAPVAAVTVGALARVRPGERIPLDGVVIGGRSSVNQAPITGESLPVDKQPGDPVFAGTMNEYGALEFRVTANPGDTTLARIVRAIQAAQAQRAPTQRFVDAFARVYTPAVVVLAVLVATLPPLLVGGPFVQWLYKALVLLVIACPCALVISTPVTVVSGLAAAARRGILIKGGVYLEEGRRMKAIALDKTGTLTHGKPAVTDILPLKGESAARWLHLAASLDAPSEHPVASAVVAHWTQVKGAGAPRAALLPVADFASMTGRGVTGVVDGRRYYVGNHRLMEELGICGPAVERELQRLEAEAKTAVVLSTETEPLAVFGVADTLRPPSVEAVRELRAMGIAVVMLTGDNPATAQAIAARAGIEDARGNLLPEDKLRAIDALLARYGVVGMVGDGINDAPALAKASVGFAMGAAGTDTALETADVALMDDDLRKLPEYLRLSRATARVLQQNIAVALGIKAVFFVLALAGFATLWMAVFADMGASLLVVFNGLRLLRHGQTQSGESASLPPATRSP